MRIVFVPVILLLLVTLSFGLKAHVALLYPTGGYYEDIIEIFSIVPESHIPLTAHAGNDTIFCASNLDEITLGENPAASGGTPPYQYSWSCNLKIRSHTFHASAFLKDTSTANPPFKTIHDTLRFQLQVTDSIGSVAIDSITVIFSQFIACQGECREFIQEGDSVRLYHCIDGGIKPYTYSWTPAETLSDPTIGNPWAKPTTTTEYELTLTDSAGCEVTSNCLVNVTPKKPEEPVMVKEGRLWSNTWIGTEHGDHYHSYYIKFEGDAAINDVQYKKILKSEDEAHTNWKLHGYIREDSSKKVFIYDDYYKKDLLLYDFGVQVGDSLMPPDSFHYVYVCDINYITFEYSHDSFMRIELSDTRDCRHPFSWIEGLGSPMGVLIGLPEVNVCCIERFLVCYFENDTLKYHHPVFKTCFPEGFPEGINDTPDEKRSIDVCEACDQVNFFFRNLNTLNSRLNIYDLNGSLIGSYKLNGENELDILPGLVPGIYLYTFKNADVCLSGKFARISY